MIEIPLFVQAAEMLTITYRGVLDMISRSLAMVILLPLVLAFGCASDPAISNITNQFKPTPFDGSAISNIAAGIRYTDFPEVRIAELPFPSDKIWVATLETLKERGDAVILADKDNGDIVTDLVPHWGVGLQYHKFYVHIEETSAALTTITYLLCVSYQAEEVIDGKKTGKATMKADNAKYANQWRREAFEKNIAKHLVKAP